MLSAALWRYICNSSLNYFKKSLLNALTANITCNRRILGFSCNLVNLVNIDYSTLCFFYVKVGSLNEL